MKNLSLLTLTSIAAIGLAPLSTCNNNLPSLTQQLKSNNGTRTVIQQDCSNAGNTEGFDLSELLSGNCSISLDKLCGKNVLTSNCGNTGNCGNVNNNDSTLPVTGVKGASAAVKVSKDTCGESNQSLQSILNSLCGINASPSCNVQSPSCNIQYEKISGGEISNWLNEYYKSKDQKCGTTPVPTTIPKATPTPAPTKAPKATPTPAPTKAPKATQTPAPTQTPKPTPTAAPTSAPSQTELSYAEQVVQLVNEERAKAGLSKLTINTTAASAALTRAKETVTSFSHTRPSGKSFSTALTEAGVSYRGCGENIAYGQKTPQEVMNGWMNSSGHRANILNANYTSIGVGVYESGGRLYWVQLFIY